MKYKLEDLIDIEHFQNLQDRLNKIYSFPSSIIDNEGKILTATAWQDICTKFHRKNTECQKLCIESDKYIQDHIHEANPSVSYRCPHGLVDNATPIIIDGIHYGNFFTGQFFLEDPDLDFFRSQAKKYGFNEKKYIEAVKKVPVWTKEQLDNYLFFIKGLIAVISESGLKKLKEIKTRKSIEESEKRFKSLFNSINDGISLHEIVYHDDKPVDYRILEINPVFERITGLKRKKAVGSLASELYGLGEAPYLDTYYSVVANNRPTSFETYFEPMDKYFRISVFTPGAHQFATVFQDITEQKRFVNELEKTKELLEDTQAITKLGGWEYNIDTNELFWTKETFRIHGLEAVKNPVDLDKAISFYDSEHSKAIEKAFQKAIEEGNPYDLELQINRTDGKKIWVKTTGKPFLENGSVVRIKGNILDIDERKKAELEFQQSENKFRTAFENASIGKTINAMAGQFIDANEAYCKITGYKKEELISKTWSDIVHPDYLEITSERIGSLIDGTTDSFVHEVKAIHKNGNIFWAKVDVVLVRDDKGKPDFLFADVEDITYQKEIETQNSQLADIIKRSQDFIGIADPKTNVIYLNPAGQEMVGLDGEKSVKESKIEDYFFPEDLPFLNETILPSLLKKGRWSGEFRFRHFKTGEPLHVLYDLFQTQNVETGEIVNYTTITRNITELKKTEQERKLLHKALENSLSSFDIVSEEGKFIYANMAYARMWGYDDPQEIIGTSPVNHCVDPTIPEQIIRRLKQKGGYDLEFIAKRKDGSTFNVLMSTQLMHDEKGNELYLGTGIDVSNLKRAEEEKKALEHQLVQAQKLESLGRLAGGVAHDLNNMLSPILGYCEMLMEDLDGNTGFLKMLQSIHKAGLSARTLVGQLLAFSRKQTLKFEIVDIDGILKGFEKLLRKTIREDIDLKIVSSPEPKTIKGDIGQLEQVVMNLSINAADAMPMGGRLTIETTLTHLDGTYASKHQGVIPGDYVLMSVTDTGHGMDKTTSENIFEPFFSTKGDHGTGLGLATVYGIIKQHKGNIWVYSEVDKGTVFKVYLPYVEGDAKRSEILLKQDDYVKGSETILLAEDQENVRNLATDILKAKGYTVIAAANGKDALEMWASGKYAIDLLITDVIMPVMNGKELYDTIHSIDPGIKVLYMSGYMDNILAPHGIMDQGADYIPKPFNVKDFLIKVRQVIDKKDQESL